MVTDLLVRMIRLCMHGLVKKPDCLLQAGGKHTTYVQVNVSSVNQRKSDLLRGRNVIIAIILATAAIHHRSAVSKGVNLLSNE